MVTRPGFLPMLSLTFTCVVASIGSSSANDVAIKRIERHALTNARGEKIDNVDPFAAVAAIIAPPTPYFPSPKIITDADEPINSTSGNDDDIRKTIAYLSKFSKYSLFKSFIISIPEESDLILAAKSSFGAAGGAPATPIKGSVDVWQLNLSGVSGVDATSGTIATVWERQLINTPNNNAFVLRGSGDEFNPDNAYFFTLDGFSANVPYNAYRIAVSDFTNGLVSRLLLGVIARSSGYSESDIVKSLNFEPPVMSAFKPSTFEALDQNIWSTDKGISAVVGTTILNSSFRSEALLYGWYAGQLFDAADKKQKDAMWHLLSYRYNYRMLGESLGYTLNYLEGYQRGQAFSTMVAGGDKSPQAVASSMSEFDNCVGDVVVGRSCHDGAAYAGPALLNERFFALLVSLYSDDPTNAHRDSIQKLIIGFNQGTLRAASISYAEIFSLGYGLGYSSGYSLGYNNGYRDGYQRGYQDGYRDGYAAAPKFDIGGIFGIVSGVGRVISEGADLVSKVAPIIGAIVSLF